MAYNNNLANDGSLQQFSELWESSRYSQRMSADPDSLRHMLEKTEHQFPDLSFREMSSRRRDVDNHRGILRLDHQVTHSVPDEGTSAAAKSLKEMRADEEQDKHEQLPKLQGTPSWLSNALMRQQPQVSVSKGNGQASAKWCSSCGANGKHCMCRNMRTTSPSVVNHPYTDWLSAVPMASTHPEDNTSAENPGREHQRVILGLHMESSTGANEAPRPRNGSNAGGEERSHERDETNMPLSTQVDTATNCQDARLRAKMLRHPLFAQMLNAHVGCLRIATPVDQVPQIDEQLSQFQNIIDKYSVFAPEEGEDKEELDEVMRSHTMDLMNFQERLQNCITEAKVGYRELEQQVYNLTGVTPGPGNGATMSDDEDEQAADSDGGGYETGLDVKDSTGNFGPLIPTETERSLMERVRQQLKLELNEGYREKLVNVREEILRKRRAGKLPEGTTTVLKTWWSAHSKWPYPTEDEKERLIQETGLELKQVNNWFINQRKRNWHSNPLSSSSEFKNKRKLG